MPPLLVLVAFALGAVVHLAGLLMMLVAAFRESVRWGVMCLVIPAANIVFLFRHWSEARRGFAVSLVGCAMAGGALYSSSDLRTAVGQLDPQFAALAPASKAKPKDLTAQIADQREQIFQLETQIAQATPQLQKEYDALAAKRKALKANDEAAITQFNATAADYTKRKNDFQKLRADLAAANENLSVLLAQRSQAAPGGSSQGSGSSAQVVMYTTKTCPACQAAKKYMASKGIAYDNRDVEDSQNAREEFEKLGGRGVPLILVGSQRMEGFSAQRLNQMIGM